MLKWFIYYRCQNVNRSQHEGGSRKHARVDDRGCAHFCPPTGGEDSVSHGRNFELLKAEMAKSKPRTDVLKDLMRRTFSNWSESYICNGKLATLLEYLSEYPLLKKASYVRHVHYGSAITDVAIMLRRSHVHERLVKT